MIHRLCVHSTFWLLVSAPIATGAAPDAKQINYARPFEPPTRPAFLALPPGAVEPAGWLGDWCLAARDGYTSRMDDVDAEFQRAWAADHTMTGSRLNWPEGAWPYEGGGYWFDGLVRLGHVLHDQTLLEQAKRRLEIVVDRSNADGILFLWWLNRNRPEDVQAVQVNSAWPLWACGLLGRALVAHYAGSRDPRVLQTLETAYGTNPDWLRTGWAMSNPWPAFETYTWTGNQLIAEGLTALFSAEGGGLDTGQWSWNRYRRLPKSLGSEPDTDPPDHVVHFLESTAPWALGYLWTGNRDLLAAALLWQGAVAIEAMQPHGVIVGDEYYGPTGAFRGTETCDVAAYLWSQILLLGVSGDGRLADRAERAFFNAAPATVARDFRSHAYFQSPNRIVDNSPPHPHGPQAAGNSYKQKHFPLCCTAAVNRILPNYVMHMWMATYDNGLAATHYGPCRVSALVADRIPVEILCRTDYPFDEVIEMTVNPQRPASFPLAFRIPQWCQAAELSVNGSPMDVPPLDDRFVRVDRQWQTGDRVRLRFPMSAELSGGLDRNAADAPFATVSYGPLLFALPIPEVDGPNTPDPATRWRYGLDLRTSDGDDIVVTRQAMPTRWDWPLESPLKLAITALPIDWPMIPEAPQLPHEPIKTGPPERITLVPYGCTKFRIAMFPALVDLER